jgi:hypothetical protein
MNALKGFPLKAFIYQDHEAHIAVHQMAMQDPLLQLARASSALYSPALSMQTV